LAIIGFAAMTDLADGQKQLEVVFQFATAVFPSVVGEQMLDLGGVLLRRAVRERPGHPRRSWDSGQIQLGEAQRTMRIHHALHVDRFTGRLRPTRFYFGP
jgi:hypothetical protein